MLTDMQLESYFESINLPDRGRKFVTRTRCDEPSRSVTEGCYQNTSSLIYSEKMGHTAQAESGTGEYAAVYEYVYSRDVLEHWDQLPPVKVKGLNKNGRSSAWTIRSDFLVLYTHGVEVHEIKADSVIEKNLAQGHPAWGRDESGEIHYYPAEEYYADLGIRFRIRPVSSFNKTLLSNYKLLLSSRNAEPLSSHLIKKTIHLLDNTYSIKMSDLMTELAIQDATPLIQMVDKEIVFCELEKEFLSDYQNIYIAISQPLSRHARSLREEYNGMRNMMDVSISSLPSRKEAEEALNRLRLLEEGKNDSTARAWKKKIKDGALQGLTPFESLLPRYKDSGNRNPRSSKEEQQVFQRAVSLYYANPSRPSVKSAYGRYRKLVRDELGDDSVITEKSFRQRLKNCDQMKLAYARGGKRMMYAHSNTSAVKHRTLKSRVAFQRAHIDHHVVKCFIVWGNDGRVDFIGKPCLSLLIDEASDMPLGYHFSFASPSRMADACVLRDCVRRYGKLPEEIVADHGSDFKSVYFRSLLASEKINLTFRPKSMSKAGSEVERFFNEFQTQWLCQREGNMVNKHAARAVDGKHASRRMAVFQPEDLLREFEQYIAHRNNKLKGPKTKTATAAFNESVATYGCVGRSVDYDERFIVASAVEAKNYTIERNDIKIDEVRYSHPSLRNTRLTNSKVEVRIEPENPYVVYAYVNNKWVSCAATGAVEFMEKTTINQQVETLKIRGAGTLRALAKVRAQDELADLLDQADKQLEQAKQAGWIDLNDVESDDTDVSINIFEQLANAEVQRLSTSTWSQP
ncbi:MAG: hypothetical protein CL561_13695 [Alphaproteobacteria bacterium]|nr:hypothetical protein [Alphaproteobacteria bacterium]